MMIKSRPKLLLVHLKRFQMNYKMMQHQKLSYRIPYPTVLHIEDNLIYHPAEDIEEETKQKKLTKEEEEKKN